MAKKKDTKTKDELKELLKKMKPAHIRFTYLYMGGEDGKCFNNATLSYLNAFEIDTSLRRNEKTGKFSKEYLSSKVNGYKLLTSANIQRLRHLILLEQGYDVENIKKRYAEIANQNKNLPLALSATDRIAKITGVIKEDSKSVDIPQLEEIGRAIKQILTP